MSTYRMSDTIVSYSFRFICLIYYIDACDDGNDVALFRHLYAEY